MINILNLFSFLNSKEGVLSTDYLFKLSIIDEFKKFKHIPKEVLDILICKYIFNPDNKELIDYFISLGGSDVLAKEVKEWIDSRFKNLNIYEIDNYQYEDVLFYGQDIDNILFAYDYTTNFTSVGVMIVADFDNAFPIDRNYITLIFHEYLNNLLIIDSKGTDEYYGLRSNNFKQGLIFKEKFN